MLLATFCALIGIFVVIASGFFIPSVRELLRGSFFLILWAVFFLLGAALIFLTVKKKVGGRLKKFLILTGTSAVGFFVSVLLHNFFYGFGIVIRHIIVLSYLMEFLHGAFFFIAILVCPIGFLIGAIGSMALFISRLQRSASR